MPTQRSMCGRAPTRSDVEFMGAVDTHSDIEARRGVAELAARLGDRLPEVVAAISASLRDDIPDLRDEAQVPLLDASDRSEERPNRPSPCLSQGGRQDQTGRYDSGAPLVR